MVQEAERLIDRYLTDDSKSLDTLVSKFKGSTSRGEKGRTWVSFKFKEPGSKAETRASARAKKFQVAAEKQGLSPSWLGDMGREFVVEIPVTGT